MRSTQLKAVKQTPTTMRSTYYFLSRSFTLDSLVGLEVGAFELLLLQDLAVGEVVVVFTLDSLHGCGLEDLGAFELLLLLLDLAVGDGGGLFRWRRWFGSWRGGRLFRW